MATLHRTTLPRRELSAAWQLGIVAPGTANGMVHAPGLLAPLNRHDRVNDGNQIDRLIATINDVIGDTERLSRLRILGMDREQAFSWRDSAERVWQLHAEIDRAPGASAQRS